MDEVSLDFSYSKRTCIFRCTNSLTSDWKEALASAAIWSIGYDSSYPVPIMPEISTHREEFRVLASDATFGKRQVGTVKINLGDHILIGARVRSVVRSDSNGWWRWKSGAIEGSCMEVEFRTRSYEPGYWALECWSVDPDLYAERKPAIK